MKAKAFLTTFLLVGTLIVPSLPAQTKAPAVSSLQRLPKTVYAYFSIPSVTEFKARVSKSLLGQMYNDSEMDEFKAELKTVYAKLSEKLKDQAGLELGEITDIVSGEVSVAVVAQGNKLGFAAFVDFTGSESAMEAVLDKADEALRDQDIESQQEEFSDTPIIVYSKADSPSKRNIAYFIKDSHLVVSNETAILEGILSRWAGGGDKSFANNDTYSYILDRCGANTQTPAMTYYIAPIELLQKAIQSGASGGNMQINMMASMLPVLGLNNLKAVGGTVDMGVDGLDTVSRMQLFVEQPASGLLKIFQLTNTDQTPPEWVGADATQFMSANWTVAEAYDAIGGLVDTFQAPGTFAQLIDQAATDENGPMVHIKKDLIDQLTGQIHVYSDIREANELGSNRTVVALGCKDTDAMRSVLAKLSNSPGFPGESRDFRGVPLIELPNPQGGEQKLVLTVADKKLMFATDVTLVEKVLRGDKDATPLVQSTEYKRVAARFPARTLMVGFQNQEGTYKAMYDVLRNGELPALSGDAAELLDEIDFSTLPPFEMIKKYLPASGSFMVSDKNGAFAETFSLSP